MYAGACGYREAWTNVIGYYVTWLPAECDGEPGIFKAYGPHGGQSDAIYRTITAPSMWVNFVLNPPQ
ncbi:MAG: hypothetical protein ISS48_04615 [Candidatus Aenigmarchaeota archaeon]|nr:hypothetical protein [Candidatus Aenigmarchaeota archaeon]